MRVNDPGGPWVVGIEIYGEMPRKGNIEARTRELERVSQGEDDTKTGYQRDKEKDEHCGVCSMPTQIRRQQNWGGREKRS